MENAKVTTMVGLTDVHACAGEDGYMQKIPGKKYCVIIVESEIPAGVNLPPMIEDNKLKIDKIKRILEGKEDEKIPRRHSRDHIRKR
jgi:hypothetical protein